MAGYNKVIMIGNLTKDPELRYIPSGAAVVNFRLAVNRIYTTQDGEKKEDVCFIDVEAWGKTAENCANYLSKGRPVLVDGQLQYRTWETEDGQKRGKHTIRALTLQFLGGGRRGEGDSEAAGMDDVEANDDIPF